MRKANFDIAYDYVRERILNGEYRAGQALPAKPLSDQTGLSSTPIRDALRQLATEGLVTFDIRTGASVKRMEVREYREMCEIRLALESHVAALAAVHHTESELRAVGGPLAVMQAITARLEVLAEDDAALIRDLGREDVRFHLAIIAAAKNEVIKREIIRLQLISRVVAGPVSDVTSRQGLPKAEQDKRRRLALKDHVEIYRAIEQRAAHQARAAMERHLQAVIEGKLISMSRVKPLGAARSLSEDALGYLAEAAQ